MTTVDTKTVHTFCRYCLASCGIEVTVEDNRVTKISADKQNPHTWQDFCAKGRTANQLVEHPRRILNPMRRVGDTYVEATWDEAITDIAARMNALIDADGPDAIGLYYGNPSGFSSSNIIFMNGWLDAVGTHNRYAVGSVDQNAMHVVAEAMYGSLLMAPVSDIDNCDYFLLVGTNPAVSAWNWLETVPGGWRRALERQRRGATIVVVDPLRTETAEKADVHLAVRPGQDWALLLAMVKVILDEGLEHDAGLRRTRHRRRGTAQARRRRRPRRPRRHAAMFPRTQIEHVARDFAAARAAMVVTRTGVSMHAGRDRRGVAWSRAQRDHRPDGPSRRPPVRARLRRRVCGWPPGQGADRTRAGCRGRDMVAGAHALSELPDEITTPGPGQIRAMVINCGNPVVSGPDGSETRRGLRTTRPVGGHRLRAARKPPARALAAARRALAGTRRPAGIHQQHARRAVRAVRGQSRRAAARRPQEWRIFTDLAIAMRKPLFGAKGVNGFIKATRRVARLTRRPSLEFGPHWIDRLLVATRRKFNGRRVKWRDVMATSARLGAGPAGVRPFQGRVANRRQEGARRAARVRRARP